MIAEFKMSIRKMTGLGKQLYLRVDGKNNVVKLMNEMKVANANNPNENSAQWMNDLINDDYDGAFNTNIQVLVHGHNLFNAKFTCAKTSKSNPQFGMTVPRGSSVYNEWLSAAEAASERGEEPKKVNIRYNTSNGVVYIHTDETGLVASLVAFPKAAILKRGVPSKVYFAKDRSGDLIKIGTSKNVRNRSSGINSNNPGVKVIKTIDGDKNVEDGLKARFQHLKKSGEWFYATNELVKFISELP